MAVGLGLLRAFVKVKPIYCLPKFSFGPSNIIVARSMSFKQQNNNFNHNVTMLSSVNSKEIFELPTYNINRTFELPTILRNLPMIAYIDQLAILEKTDPIVTNKVISENQTALRKEAAKMIRIRRRKMRKHKLKKSRKKFHFFIEKIKSRREKRKEKAFQAELLGQIKEAEVFNAEKYVHDILKTIRDRPKPETAEQRFERIRELRIKHRSNVNIIRPKFRED